jgi:hypothetical protein
MDKSCYLPDFLPSSKVYFGIPRMLTRPPRLEAIKEKQSTKWHHVRSPFTYLFAPKYIPNIERWYNTIAPVAHRDSFRFVSKAIHLHQPIAIAEEMDQCRAENMVRLYGNVLSPEGQKKAFSWVINAASPQDQDRFRDVFTAIQATFTAQSTSKSAFVYRELKSQEKPHNRLRIDWSNSKAAEAVKREDPDSAAGDFGSAHTDGKRFTKPKNQFDGMIEGMGLGTDEAFEALKKKKALYTLSDKYQVDPVTGCSTFTAKRTLGEDKKVDSHRVIATLGASTALGWISTTRDLIRNFGVTKPERITAESHPAIARTTASVGLCVGASVS